MAGGHMVDITKDPWGSSLVYSPHADGSYTLYSIGIDGRDGEDYGVDCPNPSSS